MRAIGIILAGGNNNRMRELSDKRAIAAMMRIDHAILRKIQFIEDSKDEIDYEGFRIVEYPERKYISIGTETEIYAGESFYFYPTLVFYKGTKKEFGDRKSVV